MKKIAKKAILFNLDGRINRCSMSINTFGDYIFPHFVPEREIGLIRDFWGWAGRTHKDWLDNANIHAQEHCMHGPGANGFGLPPLYATAQFFIQDRKRDLYRSVTGIYLHRWNNIGSLIRDDGSVESVSSCDRWVRIYTSEDERKRSLNRYLSPQAHLLQETQGGAS